MAVVIGTFGCSLNDTGLGAKDGSAVGTGGGTGTGGAGGMTEPPDAGVSDANPETSVDVGPPCEQSGTHRCAGTCVSNTSTASCGTSCVACPVPANGTATCNGTICGVTCAANAIAHGTTCLACDSACQTGVTPVTLPGGRFTGTTSGASANTGSCGGGAAPEASYRLVLTAPSDVFVTTHGTSFDTVVYMRRGCCAAEVACNDNADGRTTSVLAQTGLPAGTYFIFVDGAAAGAAGNFSVDIYVSAASTNPAEACGRPGRISSAPVSGDSCPYRNDYNPDPQQSCISDPGSSFDMVYYFVLDTRSRVTFNTCVNTCFDSVLYVRDVCTLSSSEQACDDDSCTGAQCDARDLQSDVGVTLDAGVHYLVLDSYPMSPPVNCGSFTITPTGIPP